jgi:hypothetical protein
MFILCLKRLKVAHLVLKQSKVAPDSKSRSRLLEREKVAQNSKSCSQVAEHMQSIKAYGGHTFQARPVWIYTQSTSQTLLLCLIGICQQYAN